MSSFSTGVSSSFHIVVINLTIERGRFLMFTEYFMRGIFKVILSYHVFIRQRKVVVFELVLIESRSLDEG